MIVSIALDKPDCTRILAWFPWSESKGVLDRHLERKLHRAPVALGDAEMTVALGWFGSVPIGFVTDADRYVAEKLRPGANLGLRYDTI